MKLDLIVEIRFKDGKGVPHQVVLVSRLPPLGVTKQTGSIKLMPKSTAFIDGHMR